MTVGGPNDGREGRQHVVWRVAGRMGRLPTGMKVVLLVASGVVFRLLGQVGAGYEGIPHLGLGLTVLIYAALSVLAAVTDRRRAFSAPMLVAALVGTGHIVCLGLYWKLTLPARPDIAGLAPGSADAIIHMMDALAGTRYAPRMGTILMMLLREVLFAVAVGLITSCAMLLVLRRPRSHGDDRVQERQEGTP